MTEAEQIKLVQEALIAEHLSKPNSWTLCIDGSSEAGGSGVGIVFKTPEGEIIEQAVRLGFKASNNEAEYKALILGIKSAKRLGVQDLVIHCDSQLLANQLTGEYSTKNERMAAYMKLT